MLRIHRDAPRYGNVQHAKTKDMNSPIIREISSEQLFNLPITESYFIIDCRKEELYKCASIIASHNLPFVKDENKVDTSRRFLQLYLRVMDECPPEHSLDFVLYGRNGKDVSNLKSLIQAICEAKLNPYGISTNEEGYSKPSRSFRAKSVNILKGGIDGFQRSFPFLVGKNKSLSDAPVCYPTKITNNIFLSGIGPSKNETVILKHLKITHICNCTKNASNVFQKQGVKYFRIPIEDKDDEYIFNYLMDAIKFIANALSSNHTAKILIHCHQGKSRSASILIAYLLWKKITSCSNYVETLHYVKSKRQIVAPNDGFRTQLIEFANSINKT